MIVRPNIFPVARCRDARAEIDFLVNAFGFETAGEYAAPDGSIMHAELGLGPGAIGLSSARATPSDHPWSKVRQGVYIWIEDVDAHHDRAKRAGAEIVVPPRDMDYGSREYTARDPEGHLWGFGTYDMAAKRAGEPNIFPDLHYRDPRAALDWFTRALGFEKTVEIPGSAGEVLHAEMRLGTGTIMLGGMPTAAEWRHCTHATHVCLPNPDAHFARARSAGAKIVQEPHTTSYGARTYYAQDPEGFLWGFST